MQTRTRALTAAALLVALAGAAHGKPGRQDARPAATTPASTAKAAPATPAEPVAGAVAEPDEATVTPVLIEAVEGNAQVRRADGAAWEPARAGMMVTQGASIRTAAKSAIRLRIGATQVLTIDRMALVRLREAVNRAGAETSTTGVEYGRVKFDVDSTRLKNDVKIEAPDATLAVRGTEGGVEVTPGFPTLAFGAEENTGVFNVAYATGRSAIVRTNEKTDAKTPDPAERNDQAAFVDTGDSKSRENDEKKVVARSTGNGGDAVTLAIGPSVAVAFPPGFITEPGPGPGPGPDPGPEGPLTGPTFYSLELGETNLFQGDLFGRVETTRDDLTPVAGNNFFSGIAVRDTGTMGRELLELRSEVRAESEQVVYDNRLFALDLGSPGAQFRQVADFTSADSRAFFTGLAALGPGLYASGIDGDSGEFGVFALSTAARSITPAVSIPGISIERGLSGANDRGSVFFFGQVDRTAETTDLGLFEVDPRTNYLKQAVSREGGAFTGNADTRRDSGLTLDTLQNVTSVAYVGGTLLYGGVVTDSGGTSRFVQVQYNPSATDRPGDPRLKEIRDVTGELGTIPLFFNLSGTPTGPLAAFIPLTPPQRAIDTRGINALFAQMAYSPESVETGVLEHLVRREILNSAIDATRCEGSGALTALPMILRRHTNQQAGVGQSVGEFRDSLPPGHPCLPPGGG